MTPIIIVSLILGWIVVSVIVCLAVCMASSRFSAQVDEQAYERKRGLFRRAQPRRAGRTTADGIDSGANPVKVKAG